MAISWRYMYELWNLSERLSFVITQCYIDHQTVIEMKLVFFIAKLAICFLLLPCCSKCQNASSDIRMKNQNDIKKIENEEEKIDKIRLTSKLRSAASVPTDQLLNHLTTFFNFSTKALPEIEPFGFDGWYHDLDHTTKGSKYSPLLHLVPSQHQSHGELPNVFKLSESLLKDSNQNQPHSNSGKNLFSVYFGIFVLNEILDSQHTSCPPSYYRISFPEHYIDHTGQNMAYNPSTNHEYMILNKLQRDKSVNGDINNPPKKLNLRTAWIDGETIYGNSKFCSDMMRTFQDGKLLNSDDLYALISLDRQCFNIFGATAVNKNPFIWTVHLIWLRWHNVVANVIKSKYPQMKDESIFQKARQLTIASMQHVIFDEWLPAFLGEEMPQYLAQLEYDPQISNEFDAIVPAYLYSLMSSFVYKIKSDCSDTAHHSMVRTCNSFNISIRGLIESENDDILTGLLLQSAQRDDQFVVEDIRRYAKGPADFTRQDLIAIMIQQNRDFATPDYLTMRAKLRLDQNITYNSLNQLTNNLWPFAFEVDNFLLQKLQTLYGKDVRKIDALVGALLENDGKKAGPLISYLLREQFIRIRNSDRFYFENLNGIYTAQQIAHIKAIKFSDIIRLVSDVSDGLIPDQVFFLPSDKDNRISIQCRHSLRSFLIQNRCTNYANTRSPVLCYSLDILRGRHGSTTETCSTGSTLDHFMGSELSFAVTIVSIIIFIIALVLLLKILVFNKNRKSESIRMKASKLRRMTVNDNVSLAQEWVDHGKPYRSVEIIFSIKHKAIKVKLESGDRVLRCIYFKDPARKVWIESSHDKAQNHLLIRIPKEYDFVLKFDSYYEREKFLAKLEAFLVELNVAQERENREIKTMLKFAYTKTKRQRHLEQFFRVVFSHAFNKKTKENVDVKTAKEIIETELTPFEFAEALSMRPESTFVTQMFSLIDKDNNGYISFREFLDVMIIFAKGSAEQKVKLMFDMYDVNQSGRLSIDDFKLMIKSLLEIANQSISQIEMDQTIHSMLNEVGFASKKELSFEEFNKLFNNYKDELGYSELNFDVSNIANLQTINKRSSALFRANDTIVRAYSYFGGKSGPDFSNISKQAPTFLKIETQEQSKEPDWLLSWIRFVDANKKEIFFIVLYTLIVIFIFVDKAYYYTYLNESSGFRQILGFGVTLTRGSASVIMFTYSTILLTMCRNLITFLRETFLHQYISFDGAVSFHKYIAFWGFIMAIIHIVGHLCNFYHISTQRPEDLNCLFREIYFVNGDFPKFHVWAFTTATGISGILLVCLLALMYIFAIQYSRRHVFNAFWRTHNLYPFFYILMVVHGLGKLIQSPIFVYFFIIPVSLFTLDRLISASRKKIEISVVKATLHPSNVTHLEFKKPPNFEYKSGQWMRIACLELNSNEYHPFTIASAPQEETLSMYIRAVGPFTENLRQIYDCNTLNGRPYPKLYLDGPYGEGHQDWLKFEVSVLVGGGIGITPFASIIKDISFRSSSNAKINCKRVYFIWVTRTQKHFEWMSDVIREAETKDRKNLLVSHIFITQFYEKFDLRTTMLYICERHFQRISNKSLFTGLNAKTHFGRPNFEVFLDSLQLEHPNVERVGVFSCGPAPMTNSVQRACETLNRKEGAIFIHHFENF